MFMGKAQLIEFSLKKILLKRFHSNETELEKMTLGRAIAELEKLGLRKDFLDTLRQLNEFRIDMAHNFLMDHLAMVASGS
jgi:hypothetical protein